MSELLNLLNDTLEVLNSTRGSENRKGCDVELGRHFSTDGYRMGRLFGVAKDNTLYRVTSFFIEGRKYGEIAVKKNFEFDHKVFEDPSIFNTTANILDGSIELNKFHRDIFVKAILVDEYDEMIRFGEDDELPDLIYNTCIAIYSPILSI